jgi:D-alanyl-lipoteichoic acid acyltransferase DltB (MBOAT superfamily)
LAFNSFQFAAFFLVVWLVRAFVLRASIPRRLFPRLPRVYVLAARNAFLLAASYAFYAAWDWRFLFLLMASTANDYVVGRALSREERPGRRRLYIGLSLAANLGLLGFFKYYDFFASSFAALTDSMGLHVDPHVLRVVLPVGISFYTFQSLSYTLDVYRGTLRAEKNLLNFAAFVAFFPQLVAGPIERPQRLLPQFRHARPVTWPKVSSGAYLIFVGLFKKVVIADTVAKVANAAFALDDPSRLQVIAGVYAFAFQIYADFSAYSDIARGASRCLGFELSRNFDTPYFAATPSEFWRRWHISLSTWLRDYLYISLGGNRKGPVRTYVNLMLTMLLGGLWHGAAWTFVFWGGFHGAVLCAYRLVEDRVRSFAERRALWQRHALRIVAVVFFFHLICCSWVFFRADSMAQVGEFFTALFTVPTGDAATALRQLGPVWISAGLVGALLIVQLLQSVKRDRWLVYHAPAPVGGLVYAVATILFVWIGDDGGESFIYFQF